MRRAPNARMIAALVLVVTGAAGGWWTWRSARVAGSRASSANASQLPTEERIGILDNSLRALADAERDMPRDRWDPTWVVGHVGRNADSLRDWVASRTSWVPYRGALRGPVGVLMDRRGNALDRALLLSALLRQAGHEVRLAHAELTASQADSMLLPLLMVGASVAMADTVAPASPHVEDATARYVSDTGAITQTLEEQLNAAGTLVGRLQERTERHTSLLLDAVPGPEANVEWSTRRDTALAALRDHWWVQLQEGGAWRDLDLLGRVAARAAWRSAPETIEPDAALAAHAHEVLVRLVTERRAADGLHEARVLEYAIRPAMTDRRVILQLWPTAWPATGISTTDDGSSLRRAALQQRQWRASLVVGDRDVANALIDDAYGASAAPSSGPLGGLSAALSGALQQRAPDASTDDLTAAWIEYDVRVPGRLSRVVRRQLFDLVGPAARQGAPVPNAEPPRDSLRLVRNLALMMRTEMLVMGAHLAPEVAIHQFARDAVANTALLHAVSQPGFTAEGSRADSLLQSSHSGVGPLHTLAVLRQEALGDLAFVDRPTILSRHQYIAIKHGTVVGADAFDIVANEIGISLAEGDGFGARLWQGVWDTNLETLLGGTEGNAAEAFEREGDWRVIESATDVVVAPDVTAAAGAVAWWRIDPSTGDALGIGPSGWGQGVDYGTHLAVIVEGAKQLVFSYALCQAIPQAANALNVLGEEFWQRGLTPRWVTRRPDSDIPEFSITNPGGFGRDVKDFMSGKDKTPAGSTPQNTGKDFEDVAYENNRKCLISAIQSGFLATAPILLMHLRAEIMLKRMPRSFLGSRARGGPLVGGRRPPRGFRGRPPTPRRGPRVNRGAGGTRAPAPGGAPPAAAGPAPIPSTTTAPARGRYDPRPADGRVPAGTGPFQGDKANRAWHRENWHPNPAQAHPATRAMGDPIIYDNADRAAQMQYEASRQSGMSDQAARAESFNAWWQSVQGQRRFRGVMQIPGMFAAEPGGGAWQEFVMDLPAGASSPPLGSPPPGASPPLGSPPPGGRVGGSPMATSVGPGASTSQTGGPLTDARLAVGFAGLTGGNK